ncbi:MAG: hypothetical protein ACI8RD_001615 [Bacillariaceae sp.]|jgi:hypothetical protein
MSSPVAAALKSEETAATKEKIPSDDSLLFVNNNASEIFLKHKRRFCRTEGCNRIVKSQGLCQRHGAKPKTCKVDGCDKQAQGNFDKMCKSHFKAMKRQTTPIPKVEISDNPPPAQGISVYDDILPRSLTFLPNNNKNGEQESENGKEEWNNTMPLILHLKHGFDTLKPPAWHRNEERRARGMFPIDNPAAQLEGWERELVWMEILVLTGVPGASFRQLARAWGRDKGFHMVLAQFICERFGETERKKRHGEKATGECGSSDGKKKRRKANKAKSKVGGIENGDDINDVGADVWDPSLYGDVDTNEALAAEIFDFTEKEFERVVSKYKHGRISSYSSETSSSTRRTSISGGPAGANGDIVAQAAMTAILGEPLTPGFPSVHAPNQHQQDGYYQREMYRDVNQNILPTPVDVTHTMTTSEGEVPVHNHQLQEIGETVAAITGVGEYHQQDLHTNPLQGEVYAAPQQMNQLIAPALSQQQQQQQQQQEQPSPHYTDHQHGHTVEYHQSTIPVIKQEPSTRPQIYEVAQVQVQAHPYQLMQQQQQQQQQQQHYQASASSQVVTNTSHQIIPAPHQQQIVQAPQQQQQEQHHQQQQHQPSHFTIPVNVAQPTQEVQVQAITQQMTHVPYTQQQYQQPLLPITTPAYSPPAQLSQVQYISQQTTYSQSPQQQQQQQPALSLHGFASMPAPQAQAPSVEQQITHVSYSQQEQDQSTRSISHQVVNVSYEHHQQQQQQQQHEQQLNSVLPTNPTPQLVQHDVPQQVQMFHMTSPQQQPQQQQQSQQHPLQYSQQTNIAPNNASAQLAQHQLIHFLNPHEHEQQVHVQAQAQNDLQQIVHDVSNPQQQQLDQQQQQTEQDNNKL